MVLYRLLPESPLRNVQAFLTFNHIDWSLQYPAGLRPENEFWMKEFSLTLRPGPFKSQLLQASLKICSFSPQMCFHKNVYYRQLKWLLYHRGLFQGSVQPNLGKHYLHWELNGSFIASHHKETIKFLKSFNSGVPQGFIWGPFPFIFTAFVHLWGASTVWYLLTFITESKTTTTTTRTAVVI